MIRGTRFGFVIGMTILSFLVSACAGPGHGGMNRVMRGDWQYYSPTYFNYIAAPGEVRTVILGLPFKMPEAAFAERVTGHMYGRPSWGPPARYTTTPSEAAKTAFYVVLVFNPPIGYDGYDACAERDEGGGPAGGEIHVVAAFCSTVHMLSEVRAAGGGIGGPDDRRFVNLVHDVMFELFPSRPPNLGPGIMLNN